MQSKVSYVGSTRGELSMMITSREVITSIDLSIPNLAAFVLRVPLSEVENRLEAFQDMMGAVLQLTLEYLKSCKVPEDLVDTLHMSIQAEMNKISDEDRSDFRGTGGNELLEQIIESEPLDVFEVHFKLPEGLIPAIHKHIVTAGLQGRTRDTLSAFHQAVLLSNAESSNEIREENGQAGRNPRTSSHLSSQRGGICQDNAGRDSASCSFVGRGPGRRVQADIPGSLTAEQLNTFFRDRWGYKFVLVFPSGKRIYRNVAGGKADIIAEIDPSSSDGWKLTRLHSLAGKVLWEAGVKLVKLAHGLSQALTHRKAKLFQPKAAASSVITNTHGGGLPIWL